MNLDLENYKKIDYLVCNNIHQILLENPPFIRALYELKDNNSVLVERVHVKVSNEVVSFISDPLIKLSQSMIK